MIRGVFFGAGVLLLGGALQAPHAKAADLYSQGGWSALASDQTAARIGDALTVMIYETATASNTAKSGTSKGTGIGGQIAAGSSFSEGAQANLNSRYDSTALTGREGRMMAQISVTVDAVLPNGDLHVRGEQVLNISGERTKIRIQGRVRRADISSGNAVLSTRIADAAIDYDGTGFVTRGSKPGLVSRLFNMLGLI
ncbi:MAG TPA: flagellar basal body L-ring protein FlgH [Caulobacteraceae bacterium]|jgi:flagellar L-ring protein precursor FlgH